MNTNIETYNIPILFIIFNRPDIASKSFLKIKEARPSKLYIAQDGARQDSPGENDIVLKTRKIILDMIDWQCEVKTLFQEQNLGCGKGVFTAISWLFQNEDIGIILEDDCVVSNSFFQFMEEMLTKYKDDQRIGMVAGSNLINSYRENKTSYFFSRYKSCWGWGSWKRAWANMDIDMNWRKDYCDDVICNSGYYSKGKSKWNYQLKCIDNNFVSAWDWQWFFTLSSQNQLCIYPAKNLVSNIGNDSNATHTSFGSITHKSHELDFPLVHPKYICPNKTFDAAFWNVENTFKNRILRMLPLKTKKILKQIIFSIISLCQK